MAGRSSQSSKLVAGGAAVARQVCCECQAKILFGIAATCRQGGRHLPSLDVIPDFVVPRIFGEPGSLCLYPTVLVATSSRQIVSCAASR